MTQKQTHHPNIKGILKEKVEPGAIVAEEPEKPYVDSLKVPVPKKYQRKPGTDEVLTLRRVINGWIVMVGDSYSSGGIVDTLVFNDIDALCEGLKIFYEEEEK